MSLRQQSLTLMLTLGLAGAAAAVPAGIDHIAAAAAKPVAQVTIQDFAFRPATLKIKVGTTVTWTNKDAMAHNVTAANGRWHSATLNQGQTYTYTFKKAGIYTYSCTFHAGMSAKVIVAK
jgi:plastocyanin